MIYIRPTLTPPQLASQLLALSARFTSWLRAELAARRIPASPLERRGGGGVCAAACGRGVW